MVDMHLWDAAGKARAAVPALALGGLLAAGALAGPPASAGADEAPFSDAAAASAGADDEAGAPFQVAVGDAEVWFTPTGDGTVAVGRGNAQGGSDYAVDASFAGALDLPATVEHGGVSYTVTAVEAFAFGNGSTEGCALTAVSIPATVTEIGQAAFMGCADLAVVDLPQDGVLATIGTSAFQRCFALEEVAFPASVVTVGDYAFAYCTALQSRRPLPRGRASRRSAAGRSAATRACPARSRRSSTRPSTPSRATCSAFR